MSPGPWSQEAIVHLAFIVPSGSGSSGVSSEERPEWAEEINVGGAAKLLEAARALPKPPRLVFSSTTHIFGRTQDQPPPRRITDPVVVTDHYTDHKIRCEEMIKASGLQWILLRFCAVPP
jgi:nucleoside-diphosphate-sugar epimerase